MNQLEILQDQFEDAAKKFEPMAHLIICSDQISVLNIPDKHFPNSVNHIDSWIDDDKLHYLLRLEGAEWNKEAALCKLKTLADKVVSWLLDNKDTPGISDMLSKVVGLGFGNPVYLWLLVLRKLRPNEAIKITGGCGNSRRAAKDNEPYYSVLEGVFLESAFVLGELLSRLQPLPTDNSGSKVYEYDPHSRILTCPNGKEYEFNPSQGKVVKMLYEAWKNPDKVAVSEKDIGSALDSFAKKFRLSDRFRINGKYNQAWTDGIIERFDKSYRLKTFE